MSRGSAKLGDLPHVTWLCRAHVGPVNQENDWHRRSVHNLHNGSAIPMRRYPSAIEFPGPAGLGSYD